MKTKTSKRLFSLLLACTMALSVFAMTVFASAETMQGGEMAEVMSSRAVSSNIKTSTAIQAPTVSYDNQTYNTVVVYNWTAGAGADQVAVTNDARYIYPMGSYTYSERTFIYEVGSKKCDAYNYLGRSYYSLTDTYSAGTTSLERLDGSVVRYGYDAKYTALGRFAYWLFSSDTSVPTSYDQEYFVWAHNSGFSRTIKGTIEYNGQIANIEVDIPMIGYKTSSVTVGGVTFSLRTGPNRCSIKADRGNVAAGSLRFVFGDA